MYQIKLKLKELKALEQKLKKHCPIYNRTMDSCPSKTWNTGLFFILDPTWISSVMLIDNKKTIWDS